MTFRAFATALLLTPLRPPSRKRLRRPIGRIRKAICHQGFPLQKREALRLSISTTHAGHAAAQRLRRHRQRRDLLHGTSSSGKAWLMPSLADELSRRPAARRCALLHRAAGRHRRGGSSKPSDGLKGMFPHYRYEDIVASEYRLITEGLGIKHLRLVLGSSMGGMHTGCGATLTRT